MSRSNSAASLARQPRELFRLQGKYLIAPDAEPTAIAVDIGCFSHTVEANLQLLIEAYEACENGAGPDPIDTVNVLYGLKYMLRMIGGISGAPGLKAFEQASL